MKKVRNIQVISDGWNRFMWKSMMMHAVKVIYHKDRSSNMSCLEPHPGIYWLFMKEKLDVYVL